MEERTDFAGCVLSEVDDLNKAFVCSLRRLREVSADDAGREVTRTILPLGLR
jgi:hypothetical protein